MLSLIATATAPVSATACACSCLYLLLLVPATASAALATSCACYSCYCVRPLLPVVTCASNCCFSSSKTYPRHVANLPLLLPALDTSCSFYCLRLLLPVTAYTCYCLLPLAPATACAGYCNGLAAAPWPMRHSCKLLGAAKAASWPLQRYCNAPGRYYSVLATLLDASPVPNIQKYTRNRV